MTGFYFQRATAHHFPDWMNTPAKTANDNIYEKGLYDMAGNPPEDEQQPVQENPIDAMMRAIQANQAANQALVECMQSHHAVIDDHERRIQNLEALLGE